ncbi:hypothetical protein Tco_1208129 [Tanacetum coccineum]
MISQVYLVSYLSVTDLSFYTSNTQSDDDLLVSHVPETNKIKPLKENIQDQQKEGSVTERKKDKKPDTSNTRSDDDLLVSHVPETNKIKPLKENIQDQQKEPSVTERKKDKKPERKKDKKH